MVLSCQKLLCHSPSCSSPCTFESTGSLLGTMDGHNALILSTLSTSLALSCLPVLTPQPFLQDRKSPHDPPSAYEGQTALHIAIVNR